MNLGGDTIQSIALLFHWCPLSVPASNPGYHIAFGSMRISRFINKSIWPNCFPKQKIERGNRKWQSHVSNSDLFGFKVHALPLMFSAPFFLTYALKSHNLYMVSLMSFRTPNQEMRMQRSPKKKHLSFSVWYKTVRKKKLVSCFTHVSAVEL